ncbi:branched chain amino acid aminotransferase [Candidatus Marsarchaeota G2 archaeon ECH_B_SAG-F08]|jgi:branched chain amino acid aminotransferase apoenzyme (EC 2.6.1.42)|uniref:Branched-chain-amino-acid aminotransferase n=5 Tax=Candidatus Marsarchaeota TaxID=1978152 RepID=A0A2R6BG80_9ARCH|nr:MAG: branched chain amino acid aminotransferase [Candidatus Marsarchaeota G1 archaeon OSP_D]PSN87938.1 MAG: branched chain amino acid aminotransferase [Candidatus Marsarchaeota G1 archaeon OSP_B]PSN89272.1 MAG: branched chain amino acid aminotransferase [Candidatus Marsarchaeota G1 archaeon OSP_C]PSN97634.1 MAG: branched chain amino acid aminotransferase [Candidatus Marsarchaeota G2 archaeon ECH_B_SAG-F08]PSO05854.1 MAG: branched chain amino acid aminotransferase [Candidatus Marsarchaeota G2
MSVRGSKVWMDGKLVDWEDAKVHVLTHALHYGTAVFEGIRVYKTPRGPAVFRLKDHLKRLYDSAKIYMMNIPYSMSELEEAVKLVVATNGFSECYVRPIVFRGYGSMGVNPLNSPVNVSIAAWEWGPYLGRNAERGVRCMVSTWRRISSQSLPPQAKSSANYANAALAKMEALTNGFDEAIMLNTEGYVTEGSGENIFRVKSGVLTTPPASAGVLRGITRDTVIKLAQEMGLSVERVNISREELYTADELFLTGTAAEVVPIREVDGRQIGTGEYPITLKIRERYLKLVHGELDGHEDWFTFVN